MKRPMARMEVLRRHLDDRSIGGREGKSMLARWEAVTDRECERLGSGVPVNARGQTDSRNGVSLRYRCLSENHYVLQYRGPEHAFYVSY
jgi:hypothetical protein